MEAEAQTPYSTPKTEECLAEPMIVPEERQIIQPLTRLRLVIAMTLVAGALIAFWAAVNHQQFYGLIVATICVNEISRVIDPHALRRGTIRTILLDVIVFGFFVALFWWRELPPVAALLGHPLAYCVAWLSGCGLLLRDWRKRRNNPQYRPEPHLDPAAFSRWKRMRRLGIRD